MDRVLIEALQCEARVGVTEQERSRPQRVLVDVELELPLKEAGLHDRMDKTLDYQAVAEVVKAEIEGGTFRLVEALAERAAARLIQQFGPRQVRIRVRKFSLPDAHAVAVEIVRKRARTLRARFRFPKA